MSSTPATDAADPTSPRQQDLSARDRLLQAALVKFDADGALGATLEDIRREAGVSVGALYHHFPDKAGLAAALYAELTRAFQDGFLAELRARSGAEDGVKAGVRFYLRWVSANRTAAAFLLGGATHRRRRTSRAQPCVLRGGDSLVGDARPLRRPAQPAVRPHPRAVARPGARVHAPLGGRPRQARAGAPSPASSPTPRGRPSRRPHDFLRRPRIQRTRVPRRRRPRRAGAPTAPSSPSTIPRSSMS